MNGQPGATVRGPDDKLISVLALDIVDGQIQTVRGIINPDKLQHLGEVADLSKLQRPT